MIKSFPSSKRKQINYFKYLSLFPGYLLIFIMLILLANAPLCSTHAKEGLKLWYQNIVPSLLPFMIISEFMIMLDLPVVIFKNKYLYCIFVGFLCGFPMGAKAVSTLYQKKNLNKIQAEYLLCFCNLLGPSYFLGYIVPLLKLKPVFPYLFGMYGIPLLYGIILFPIYHKNKNMDKIFNPPNEISLTYDFRQSFSFNDIFFALSKAVRSAMNTITSLCGIIIFFQVITVIPELFLPRVSPYLSALLEINSGMALLSDRHPLFSLTALSFGGICCYAQTSQLLSDTDLSCNKYFLHKLFLTGLSFLYYSLILP